MQLFIFQKKKVVMTRFSETAVNIRNVTSRKCNITGSARNAGQVLDMLAGNYDILEVVEILGVLGDF